MLSALAFALTQTMVAPALPAIQEELGTSATEVTWVLTVFLLTASIATPIIGRLGDMFGKERVLLAVLGVFAIGSLVGALSHSIEMLIAGRAIQGVAGAIFPLAFGIIRDEFPRERVATGDRPDLGDVRHRRRRGPRAQRRDRRQPLLRVDLLARPDRHRDRRRRHATSSSPSRRSRRPPRSTGSGAALLSGALGSLLLGVSEGNEWGWGSPRVLGLFAAAAVLGRALGALRAARARSRSSTCG